MLINNNKRELCQMSDSTELIDVHPSIPVFMGGKFVQKFNIQRGFQPYSLGTLLRVNKQYHTAQLQKNEDEQETTKIEAQSSAIERPAKRKENEKKMKGRTDASITWLSLR